MLARAIAAFHDLLNNTVAADKHNALLSQARLHDMQFGERPVCSVLRPRFLSARQFQFLNARVRALLPAFRRLYDAALSDSAFRRQFCLRPEEETLLADDPGISDPSPTAWLDSFFVS